jgi:cation transport ATPase
VAEDVQRIVITAALLVAFTLLLWAFAVSLWDFLKERTRGWLRVMLVVVLAASCALAAAVEARSTEPTRGYLGSRMTTGISRSVRFW